MNSQVLPANMAERIHPDAAVPERGPLRRHLGGIILAAGALGLLAYGVLVLLDPQTLPIRHVRIQGEFQHLSTDGLQERASRVVRGGFFNVNVETIQRVLLEEPWIRTVSVKRVWPDRITVSIREQTAVARWNGSALLNDEARIFAPEPATFPSGLPVLRGPEGSHGQMLDFYQQLRAALPPDLRISEVTLSSRRSWHVGFVDGPHVYLGRTNISKRTRRFVEYLPQRLGEHFDRIRSVDMRYTNGFAVRWEPDYKPDL
jgi:cell division protein FtsQ